MKQDIAEYLVDSFVDFKGAVHQVVLCALSQSPVDPEGIEDLGICWHDGCYVNEEAGSVDVYRTLSIGFAICNPCDTFDFEKGKRIALHKAEQMDPKLYSTTPGVINTTLVRAFLHQEMEYLKKYPGKFINGYDEAAAKFEARKTAEEELKNLSTEEAEVVQAIVNHVDLDKCIRLSKYVKKTI